MKPKKYIDYLNKKYFNLHKNYEELFWISYMGDHSVDKRKDEAQRLRDKFRADPILFDKVKLLLRETKGKDKKRLNSWKMFFERHQTPIELLDLKNKITKLESAIMRKRAGRKEGYIDPKTKKFIKASENEMRMVKSTHPDQE